MTASSLFGDPMLVTAGSAALALVLLIAVLHKLGDREAFESAIAQYRLLPAGAAAAVSVALILAELALAAGLLVPAIRPWALMGTAGLLALYALAMAANLLRGRRTIDCGCGGPGQPVSWALVVRNLVLGAVALGCSGPLGERSINWHDRLEMVLITIGLLALYLMADELLRQAGRLADLRRTD